MPILIAYNMLPLLLGFPELAKMQFTNSGNEMILYRLIRGKLGQGHGVPSPHPTEEESESWRGSDWSLLVS